jgi:hypothetical protein
VGPVRPPCAIHTNHSPLWVDCGALAMPEPKAGQLLRLRGLESKAKGLDLVIPLSRFGVHVADQFRLFLRRATYGIGWGWES